MYICKIFPLCGTLKAKDAEDRLVPSLPHVGFVRHPEPAHNLLVHLRVDQNLDTTGERDLIPSRVKLSMNQCNYEDQRERQAQ
jgi:hypothetical protein